MATKKIRYIVDENGKQTEVVMPALEYRELMEDLHDLAVIAERRDEETISLEAVKRSLREHGRL